MDNHKLSELLQQEAQLQFTHFNHDTAWQLGCALREAASALGAAVSIEVYAFEQVLFSTAMPTTTKDNLEWMKRKRQAVMRFGHSSYYLGQYNSAKGRELERELHIDPLEYCSHGGAFPIRVKQCGLIGVVTVSGLPQKEDHTLVVSVLQALIHD